MILVMYHAMVITSQAMVLSLTGGMCVYVTIIGYIHLFANDDGF
jgi:hypothetical protein